MGATVKSAIFLFLTVFLFEGCATIVHGTRQTISISSVPPSAAVAIDGLPSGNTPVFLDLDRGAGHTISISKDDYTPYTTYISSSMSGWVFGNIIFGGLIGLIVDASTGGLYNLSPEFIQANLIAIQKSSQTSSLEDHPPHAYAEEKSMSNLVKGDEVAVYLKSGKILRGSVSEVKPASFILENQDSWKVIKDSEVERLLGASTQNQEQKTQKSSTGTTDNAPVFWLFNSFGEPIAFGVNNNIFGLSGVFLGQLIGSEIWRNKYVGEIVQDKGSMQVNRIFRRANYSGQQGVHLSFDSLPTHNPMAPPPKVRNSWLPLDFYNLSEEELRGR
jgi:hypothetical protein